jgi:hypothetical protein
LTRETEDNFDNLAILNKRQADFHDPFVRREDICSTKVDVKILLGKAFRSEKREVRLSLRHFRYTATSRIEILPFKEPTLTAF